MDLSKIFLKDACPTKMGGQAVMEGIMMKGEKKTALAVRLPNDDIQIKTVPTKVYGKWTKIPLLRGVVAFIDSMVTGTKTLMDSAEMLEDGDEEEYEESRFEAWLNKKFGAKGAWNLMIYFSVFLALVFTVGIFIILPTGVVNLMKLFTDSVFWLNFAEGVFRILLFVAYVWLISFMGEIKRVFQFHGAEHKTIHCFENGLELTPANCRQFPTLHPRCGTSFLMFVFIIAFALLAFILSLKTDMGLSGNDPKVGVIDGSKIRYSEYIEVYNNLKDQSNISESNEEQMDQLAEMAWQTLIANHVYLPGFEKMGISVTDAEREGLISGEYYSGTMAAAFTDPRTGGR